MGTKWLLHGAGNRYGASFPSTAQHTADEYRAACGFYVPSSQGEPGAISLLDLIDESGNIIPNNPLDVAIADALAYLAKTGVQQGLMFRVNSGYRSPNYMKAAAGTVTLTDPTTGKTETIPRYWDPKFADVWFPAIGKLAVKYDPFLCIGLADMSRNMTFYDEPDIHQIASRPDAQALVDAGWSADLDVANQEADFPILRGMWKLTPLSGAFNPYQYILRKPDGTITVGEDDVRTLNLMKAARAVDPRFFLGNNSVRETLLSGSGSYQLFYQQEAALGQPIHYQFATIDKVGDLITVLQWCAKQGASSVELPTRYETQLTPEQVQQYGNLLPLPYPPPPPMPQVTLLPPKIDERGSWPAVPGAVTYHIMLDNGPAWLQKPSGGPTESLDITTLTPGQHVLQIIATDQYGQSSNPSWQQITV